MYRKVCTNVCCNDISKLPTHLCLRSKLYTRECQQNVSQSSPFILLEDFKPFFFQKINVNLSIRHLLGKTLPLLFSVQDIAFVIFSTVATTRHTYNPMNISGNLFLVFASC